MSHADYFFLMDIEEPADWTDEELRQEAADIFYSLYFEKFCDENSWFEHQGLVFPTGTLLAYPNSKTDGVALYHSPAGLGDRPEEERWAGAWYAALQEAAWALLFSGKRDQSFEKLLRNIRVDVANVLVSLYQRTASLAMVDQEDDFPHNYNRYYISRGYEAFRRCPHPPFSDYIDEPYFYRCWDLRMDGGTLENVAILITDIHT